jgi:hypothetical protein
MREREMNRRSTIKKTRYASAMQFSIQEGMCFLSDAVFMQRPVIMAAANNISDIESMFPVAAIRANAEPIMQ